MSPNSLHFFVWRKYQHWYSVSESTQIQVSVLYGFEKGGIVASLILTILCTL